MAKFRLKEGEQVIERTAVVDPNDVRAFQTLMLTDKRVVLLRNVPIKLPWFGTFLGHLGKFLREDRVEEQISRTELESADTNGRHLTIKSNGSIYVSRIDVEVDHAERWATVLRGWAAGDATEIATATVVKRD
jgi:hypothetical protein